MTVSAPESPAPSAPYPLSTASEMAGAGRRRWSLSFRLQRSSGYLMTSHRNGHGPTKGTAGRVPGGLPVNTIHPIAKTLVRTLEQPGSIRADAQAELCTKTAGFAKFIQRELDVRSVAMMIADGFGPGRQRARQIARPRRPGSSGRSSPRHCENAPEKDIGCWYAWGKSSCNLMCRRS